MRISDWSSDVCSSDLGIGGACELHDTGGRLADADGRDRLRHAERAQLLDERHGVWRATVRCDAQLHHSRCGVLDQPRKPFQELPVRRCDRSEEHTSELQSLMRNSYAVFCLKKKTSKTSTHKRPYHTK